MSKIDDARAVMQGLSGKQLTDQQMLSIAQKFASVNRFTNPWDPDANPAEYAAWPTGLELADFFLTQVRRIIRNNLEVAAEADFTAGSAADYQALEAQREALKAQYVGEL